MPEQLPITCSVVSRMRFWRRRRRLTAEQLATAITASGYEVSRVTITKAECGRVRAVPIDLVVHAAEVLGVPFDALLNGAFCEVCEGLPPRGMTCNECGTSTPVGTAS